MNNWVFKNQRGADLNPNQFIFALTSVETPGQPFRVIGTAFLIARPGIFLTARHCLYKDDACTVPYGGMVGILDDANDFRWSIAIEGTDVAIGQLDVDAGFEHPVLTPCEWTPIEKERIVHWGCDLTEISVLEQDGDLYRLKSACKVRGVNGHYIQSMDSYPPFTRTRCHITSAETPHSASGGPVLLSTGQVFGISTSSSKGGGYSIVSMVKHAFDCSVPPHFRMNGEKKRREQTWGELLAESGAGILRGD